MSMYCLPSFKMEVISYYSLIDDCYHQLLAPDRTFNQRRSPLPFPYHNETPTPAKLYTPAGLVPISGQIEERPSTKLLSLFQIILSYSKLSMTKIPF